MYQRTHTPTKKKRKFVAIAKIDSEKFVKYRTNHPEKFLIFLVKKFPGVRFCNFFINFGPNERKLYATWGSKKGLIVN